jgi:hypothetical protein
MCGDMVLWLLAAFMVILTVSVSVSADTVLVPPLIKHDANNSGISVNTNAVNTFIFTLFFRKVKNPIPTGGWFIIFKPAAAVKVQQGRAIFRG